MQAWLERRAGTQAEPARRRRSLQDADRECRRAFRGRGGSVSAGTPQTGRELSCRSCASGTSAGRGRTLIERKAGLSADRPGRGSAADRQPDCSPGRHRFAAVGLAGSPPANSGGRSFLLPLRAAPAAQPPARAARRDAVVDGSQSWMVESRAGAASAARRIGSPPAPAFPRCFPGGRRHVAACQRRAPGGADAARRVRRCANSGRRPAPGP